MLYDATCSKCGTVEIDKPMAADFPVQHILASGKPCGGTLKRCFAVTTVHFAAQGFYSTDVGRLRGLMGPERYAKFEKQRAGIERRAKSGRLTSYERTLETL